ncbi:LysR family transcriptional regulator [Nonomuraea sediminis]|uniref:LysR family transcriptional regulator n=1 Tax=Nonomuraea sediminis TaxID=2835864 RepID=UPI001BDD581B|nr:LysR substrate-binding domain-containing protein [Nonomuraea sediminis]
MELRQLEYFVAVAEEAGFTKAAARLHVAQPGVSAQIRQLERELGQELFDRSGRSVRLTPVGKAVLPYARAALAAVVGAREVVDEMSGLLRGHVTMGAVTAPSVLDLPGLLAGFHRGHPGVEISLVELDPVSLVEAVVAGRVDLGLAGLGAPLPPGLDTQIVIDQPLVVVVPHDDELAKRTSVELADLRDRPLITLPMGTGLRSVLENACAAVGFRPRVAFEASEPYVLAQFAARGLGVAVLPESAAADADIHVLTLAGPRLRGQMALIWRAEGPTSPAATALIAHARRLLPTH